MRLGRRRFLSVAVTGVLAGCGYRSEGVSERFVAWGTRGLRNGEFRKPRAIGVRANEVFVVDTTGRVQVFDADGAYLRGWSTPSSDNGTPTAVAFAPDGDVLVPDTHYSRILKYTADGELAGQWGSYGKGPDEFIYPTDICTDEAGTYYVSEYGLDADRIHVFDKEQRFVCDWGATGEAPGLMRRCMAIEMGVDGLLYTADTANHRIQCFERSGKLVRVIGEPGTEEGQLKYPYDVSCAVDGSVVVCEYGNHRLSRFSADGGFVGCFGRPGRALGCFNGPRGAAVSREGMVFVADTDNHRVQRFSIEELS
ncbi:MAG: hypothetical protein GWP08_14925 [Nitrospiraceae bacterium]|nr:hypothetical protein [Nitrospiraceae bacterium]